MRALYWQIVTGVGCCGKLGAGRLAPFGLKVEGCIRCGANCQANCMAPCASYVKLVKYVPHEHFNFQ